MELKQKVLLLIGLYIIIIILPQALLGAITLSEEITDSTALVPGNIFIDQIFLFIIGPIIMVILVFLFATPIALLLFKLHNTIKVKKYDYYIIENFEGNLNIFRIYVRCLIVAFLSFALAMMIYEAGIVPPEIIIAEKTSVVLTDYDFVSMIAILILPYLILIFAPIWLLRDSGVICSKSEVNKKTRETPDIEGIYRLYNSAINGYTGIGFILTLIVLIIDRIQNLDPGSGEITDIPWIILTPFMMGLLVFPAAAFYEYRLKQMKLKLLNKLEKGNIVTIKSIKETL